MRRRLINEEDLPPGVWDQLKELGVVIHPEHGFMKMDMTLDEADRRLNVTFTPVTVQFTFEVKK